MLDLSQVTPDLIFHMKTVKYVFSIHAFSQIAKQLKT